MSTPHTAPTPIHWNAFKTFVPPSVRARLRPFVVGTADRLYALVGERPGMRSRPALYVNDEGILKLRPDLSAKLHQNPAVFAIEAGLILQFYRGGIHLDVGCGLRKVTASAIGIDVAAISGPFLASGVNIVTTADRLDAFSDESVDFISCIHSFEHYANPKAVVREWLRVLKPGGRIGIIVPDRRGVIPEREVSTAHEFDYDEQALRAVVTDVAPHCNVLALGTLQNGWSIDLVMEKPLR